MLCSWSTTWVIDTLYKKNNGEVEESLTTYENREEDDQGNTDDNEVIYEEYGLRITLDRPSADLVSAYKDLIKKVRKVVKIFKNSPLKNVYIFFCSLKVPN